MQNQKRELYSADKDGAKCPGELIQLEEFENDVLKISKNFGQHQK